jgi:heme-degrading monooxygenase HmoA
MFARVTTFQGEPDSVDGSMRFPLKKASSGIQELPGFLAMFDLADRKTGQAVVVTLWATKEARDESSGFALAAGKKVAEETGEQVISVRDYEVGHYLFSEELPRTAVTVRSSPPLQ